MTARADVVGGALVTLVTGVVAALLLAHGAAAETVREKFREHAGQLSDLADELRPS